MQRVVITGSSGYYGRKLIAHARRELPDAKFLGIDVVPPRDSTPDEFTQSDIRDARVREAIEHFQPDTVIHLAFVLNPTHNDREMHDINVGGAQNVFQAVRAIRPRRFLMSSSATAYGAWPDNPIPIDETWPLRACVQFRYANDKTALEAKIKSLSEELPDVAVSWTRPTVIGGAGINNYLSRVTLSAPIVFLPDGDDVPMQFVHEDDCAAATWHILRNDGRGPFNIAPADWISLKKIAELTKRKHMRMPYWCVKLMSKIWWELRLPIFDFPPSMLDFTRYPWIISPTRLTNELGFQFRYSSEQTLMEMWNTHQERRGAKTS